MSAYTFDQYAQEVLHLAQYPSLGSNTLYPTLGLVGEAGEVAEKVKKLWRNQGKTTGLEYTLEERMELAKELGDVLWYITAVASECLLSLEQVARENSFKLNDRHRRGVIKSEGDNR